VTKATQHAAPSSEAAQITGKGIQRPHKKGKPGLSPFYKVPVVPLPKHRAESDKSLAVVRLASHYARSARHARPDRCKLWGCYKTLLARIIRNMVTLSVIAKMPASELVCSLGPD
jgi:hypothetical protein